MVQAECHTWGQSRNTVLICTYTSKGRCLLIKRQHFYLRVSNTHVSYLKVKKLVKMRHYKFYHEVTCQDECCAPAQG